MARAQVEIPGNAPAPRPMPALARFDAGDLPSSEMSKFTKEVNLLISEYNQTPDANQKKQILKNIQIKMQEVDYRYQPEDFSWSPEYHEARGTLFKEIKYQYASLGSPSLLDDPAQRPSTLAEIIANMSPDKADKLTSILIKGAEFDHNAFVNLYDAYDNTAEAHAFRQFLNDYQISYLGGGNSKNFKITHRLNGSSEVLKIDYRLNAPRHVEAHLRKAKPEHLTPIAAERQTLCPHPEYSEVLSRTLLVTEFCQQGSVIAHRAQLAINDATSIELAHHTNKIFQKMTRMMLDIQHTNCMFPDAKLYNWLIDRDDTLRIADTKSFLFTDAQGNYSKSLSQNKYTTFLSTKNFRPPEFFTNKNVSSDAVHAYLLGKNLYLYITGKVPSGDSGAHFDFSGKFFDTPEGKEYPDLIDALVKSNPAERMSVRDAMERLFTIEHPAFKTVMEDLQRLKFGKNDTKMNEYIQTKHQQIQNASPVERAAILQQLQATVTALKNDTAAEQIRTTIQNFREGSRVYTRGMKDKAARIENAMANVPIEDRAQFLTAASSQEVMVALASHRHLGKGGKTYLTDEGKIDTKKAAQSFKDFKKAFKEQVEEKAADVDEAPQLKH